MSLVVQKFGGTSVADSEKILAAARKAVRAHQHGHQVVMVVSAMGKNTDTLISLAAEINEKPPAREMDMLLSTGEQVSVALMAMAIDSLGYKGVSLTGAQIGIKTDSSHTKARIHSISTDRMKALLDEGNIVIAAGFQGIDDQFNITTLGRGGSDTTAVALAAVLGADQCEIYTDVDGIYTTDPRVLPEACLVPRVCYDEMLELASLGAGVMHSRSIEFGKKFNVPIHVRSSLSDGPGSLIVDDADTAGMVVSGAALTRDEAMVSVMDVPDVPGTILKIFKPIADRKITVDMIVQNVSDDDTTSISFTVPRGEAAEAVSVIKDVVAELGGTLAPVNENVSKVSAVGLGMAHEAGVANRMFRVLADAGINLEIITTSEIKISVLVDRTNALDALRTIHGEFSLDKIEAQPNEVRPSETAKRDVSALDVIERLQVIGMEALTIDDIVLDNTQARITICKIPNRPGLAASLFEQIADKGVFVDMIVQSFNNEQIADITFTVKREQLQDAVAVAEEASKEYGCEKIDFRERISKLSVSGIGMRSHTGVAMGSFEALAEAGINVEMISTSEVRVNVVVDGDDGARGLECLQTRFAEELES
ncbi:aspartate kinase [Mariniblastus fucicola]|uniref:aspartate kinase n=1 Tax=Mariniblastus fucicola TaxID=980251 RepID=A0A5B9P4M5_9BACT|nr:aspartate kinase [Mariniblastus fucicola]QEG21234.1 Aspartokinase [Mariniblastus fucicola]